MITEQLVRRQQFILRDAARRTLQQYVRAGAVGPSPDPRAPLIADPSASVAAEAAAAAAAASAASAAAPRYEEQSRPGASA